MNLLKSYRSLGDEAVAVFYAEGEEPFARLAFDALHAALTDLLKIFRVSTPFPRVRVALVDRRSEFDRLVRDWLRVEIESPSHPARIAQPQRTDLVALSPSAYATDSVYRYQQDEFQRLLAHELVHMFEEFLSPNIENTPRWWSEGLAIYFSDQWRTEDEFRSAALDGAARRDIPGFWQIESERKLAYDWGWTVVRFIEQRFGRERILQIVRECADGDVFSILGHPVEQLEARWRDWLLEEGSLTGL